MQNRAGEWPASVESLSSVPLRQSTADRAVAWRFAGGGQFPLQRTRLSLFTVARYGHTSSTEIVELVEKMPRAIEGLAEEALPKVAGYDLLDARNLKRMPATHRHRSAAPRHDGCGTAPIAASPQDPSAGTDRLRLSRPREIQNSGGHSALIVSHQANFSLPHCGRFQQH